ncbi:MAG TPA: hypothetical protein DCR32_05320, partial [Opitutae bacterium]|nr:hypothetical protein [Opitutae bacterium]
TGEAEAALAAEKAANDIAAGIVAVEPDQNEAVEEEEEEDKPDFDIYLRESARIMADWIEIEASDNAAVTATKVAVSAQAL